MSIFRSPSPVELFSEDVEVGETGPDNEAGPLLGAGDAKLVAHPERDANLAIHREHHMF